jgi:SOS-response transcriptional repressor LexA
MRPEDTASIEIDLMAFVALMEREGLPPTIREFQDELGLSSVSVADYHLRRLGWNSYLEPRGVNSPSRGWRLTDDGRRAARKLKRKAAKKLKAVDGKARPSA